MRRKIQNGNHVERSADTFASEFPHLAKLAHGWSPETVRPKSGLKKSWKCDEGHVWSARICDIANGRGCPYCSGKKVLEGFNDLKSKHPDIADQADGWDPSKFLAGSAIQQKWRCGKGHSYLATIYSRTGRGVACPYCANKKVLIGYNDLATTNPLIAKQACGWDPETVTAGSGRSLRWRCEYGHEWNAAVKDRQRSGCPFCSGRNVIAGKNDLATLHPAIASEAHGWDPLTVHAKSHAKRTWQCSIGHRYEAIVHNRTINDSGCPFCSGNKVLVGYNDCATVRPDLVIQAINCDLAGITAGSSRIVKWRCRVGHEWTASVKSRLRGTDCPVCSGNQVLQGFNDLVTTHPDVASQLVNADPTKFSRGSKQLLSWQCQYGHVWEASPNSRTNGWRGTITGCPTCTNRLVVAGFNDLGTTHPELLVEVDGWDATRYSAGSAKRRSWKCQEGHRWVTAINVRTAGRGCPTCSKAGFDPNRDGWLYLVEHEAMSLLQIGITNFPSHRIRDHELRGWDLLDVRGPADGHYIRDLERDAIRALKRHGAVFAKGAGIPKFDGFTESWLSATLNIRKTADIARLVIEDDWSKDTLP